MGITKSLTSVCSSFISFWAVTRVQRVLHSVSLNLSQHRIFHWIRRTYHPSTISRPTQICVHPRLSLRNPLSVLRRLHWIPNWTRKTFSVLLKGQSVFQNVGIRNHS